MDDVQLTKEMMVFPQRTNEDWTINVSIYCARQIMVIARHRWHEHTMIKTFLDPEEAAEFIRQLDGEYYE